MFADPQAVTIDGVANSLPRTSSGDYKGTFQTADGTLTLTINHDRKKRTRHYIQLRKDAVVSDPLVSGTSTPASMSVSATIDVPPYGFTAVDQQKFVAGFQGLLSASSNAAVIKLLGNES